MKKLIFLLLAGFLLWAFTRTTSDEDNENGLTNDVYDLSIGVKRYFNHCVNFFYICQENSFSNFETFPFSLSGIESVLDHVAINGDMYAQVEWHHSRKGLGLMKDTLYYRVKEERLYQYTGSRDSLIYDFSFKRGDNFPSYFESWFPISWDTLYGYWSSQIPMPESFIYDTTAVFPNGREFRVVLADNFEGASEEFEPPTQAYFVENMLKDDAGWLIPLYKVNDGSYNFPTDYLFFYIESLGIVRYHATHHFLPMSGAVDRYGNEYGFRFTYVVSTVAQEHPQSTQLHQNYPNPFNPQTTIRYELAETAHISLAVYDLLGRWVALLQEGIQGAGSHQTIFDASSLASGLYIVRLETAQSTLTRKMFLLK